MGTTPLPSLYTYSDSNNGWQRTDGRPVGFTCKECRPYIYIKEFEKLVITVEPRHPKPYWCVRIPRTFERPEVQVVMGRCRNCDKKYSNYKRASRKAEILQEANATLHRNTYLWLITMTLDGTDPLRVSKGDLAADIETARKEMLKRFRRIRDRSPMFKIIQGGLYALEFKSKKGDLHPHIHMVAMIDSEALDGRKLLPKSLIKMFKKECMKYKFGRYVNVRRIDQITTKDKGRIRIKPDNKDAVRASIRYAVKYAVKESGNATKTTGWFGNMYGSKKNKCILCLRRFCEGEDPNTPNPCRQTELGEFLVP